MLTSLPTPIINTNGNGNGHHQDPVVKLVQATPARKAKTQAKPTPENKPAAYQWELECEVEEYKELLLQDAKDEAAFLTGCYTNWFDHMLRHATFDETGLKPGTVKTLQNTLDAWKHARDTFNALAAMALRKLVMQIADDVENRFAFDPVTASDVSTELRNLTQAELLENK